MNSLTQLLGSEESNNKFVWSNQVTCGACEVRQVGSSSDFSFSNVEQLTESTSRVIITSDAYESPRTGQINCAIRLFRAVLFNVAAGTPRQRGVGSWLSLRRPGRGHGPRTGTTTPSYHRSIAGF